MQSVDFRQLGQKFIIGFSGTTVTQELREWVRRYHFGNFILFRDNLTDAEQTRTLCRELEDLALEANGILPLICIDQEGGMVTRLAEDSLNIPGAMALAASGDPELVRRMNQINGLVLRELGFNLNLAPVADINTEADNPVIGTRSFSDDPEQAVRLSALAFEGLKEAGILASAKHFPGHGNTKVDSHLGLPKVDEDRELLDNRELVPFRKLTGLDIDAVMTAHILFPALEPEPVPATMSRKIVTGLLRDEMQYTGLVLSDCMEMQAVASHYGTVQGVLKAFEAGVDLVFISHTPERAVQSIEAVREAYEDGLSGRQKTGSDPVLRADELAVSLERIRQAKEKLTQANPPLSDEDKERFAGEIRDSLPRTFCVLPEKTDLSRFRQDEGTLVLGPPPFRATKVSNAAAAPISFAKDLAENLGARGLETPIQPDAGQMEKILRAAADADAIILGLYNAHVYTTQLELWKALRQTGKPILAAALRNPYDLMYLEEGETGIAVFEYTKKSITALGRCIRGEVQADGTLPAALPNRKIG